MRAIPAAIIGAGPYGLSLAAHLGARHVEHRVFGRPMRFWAQIAEGATERYLKSFCFATNLSTPRPGFTFAEYNRPRGLETFEPCSMANFTEYGQWFQKHNVPWCEPLDVTNVERGENGFVVTIASGERVNAGRVVVATGLAHFATSPAVLADLPSELAMHTSRITSFEPFRGRSVAIIGAGQSALEAAALLHEVGAQPQLLVRESKILWHKRVSQQRTLWQQVRSPISGLGVGPKAWALIHFPGALHRLPDAWRSRLTKGHLPPEGAWWLRPRVENLVPVQYGVSVTKAQESGGQAVLRVSSAIEGKEREIKVDHVISGSGYDINVDRLPFLAAELRGGIERLGRSPRLSAHFESSVPGLHFIGPTSAMSFGPLFRFVVGADYTAQVVSDCLASQVSEQVQSQVSYAA